MTKVGNLQNEGLQFVAVIISCMALGFAIVGNVAVYFDSKNEREHVEQAADKATYGLVCLLQRAQEATRANAIGRSQDEVELIIDYYQREIDILGGRRDCSIAGRARDD